MFSERGAKPVTNFMRNLSALSSWHSVYTSAIAFIVSQRQTTQSPHTYVCFTAIINIHNTSWRAHYHPHITTHTQKNSNEHLVTFRMSKTLFWEQMKFAKTDNFIFSHFQMSCFYVVLWGVQTKTIEVTKNCFSVVFRNHFYIKVLKKKRKKKKKRFLNNSKNGGYLGSRFQWRQFSWRYQMRCSSLGWGFYTVFD